MLIRPVIYDPIRPCTGSITGTFLVGEPPLPAYDGIVATRGIVPNRKHATSTRTMSQTRHFARDSITSLKVMASNWWLNGTTVITEAAPGATMSVTASVSLDGTTWTQFTWAGGGTGTVADGGDLVSDALVFSIPRGTTFFIRMWKSCAAGIIHCEAQGDPTSGEQLLINTTAADSTAGGAFTGNANFFTGGPTAIIGTTTRKSVLILGDSISYGFDDDFSPSASGDLGKIAPSIGSRYGYIMGARNSDAAVDFLASGTRRTALAAYVSHVVAAYGRNDLDDGRTPAQFQADVASIVTLFSVPVLWDTITPRSASTDGWVTVVNQTTAGSNTSRSIINTWLRTVPAGLAGVFDSCQAVENDPIAQDGKWIAGPITNDGQHPNPTGYNLIESSGQIGSLIG